jgi:predicted RNase H-like nuclease (RuvC/YqgF family)
MILHSNIEDIVNEIKSGKLDLFTIILDYKKEIEKLENKVEIIEEMYENEINELQYKNDNLKLEVVSRNIKINMLSDEIQEKDNFINELTL